MAEEPENPNELYEEEQTKKEILSNEELDAIQGYGYPSETKDTPFKFFLKILGLEDDTKVSFINNTDLHNVRLYQDTADYAAAEGWDIVSAYCRSKGEVILATAMSRDGFFLKTAVTQIRQVNKAKQDTEKKSSFWGKKEEEQ